MLVLTYRMCVGGVDESIKVVRFVHAVELLQ